MIDIGRLENACRNHLNKVAPRRMAVLSPLKVVIENYPEDQVEFLEAMNNPEDPAAGGRQVPFCREIFIDREDFMENPPKKFFRLAPGAEVRLRSAYWVKCTSVVKDEAGNITEVRCTYDPQTRGGGNPPDGRKVKGTIHWVSARHGFQAEVRLFDRLFKVEEPGKASGDYMTDINPDSLAVITNAIVESSLAERGSDEPAWEDGIRRFQFERVGYFCFDKNSSASHLVLNRTVTLKDAWAKLAEKS
jgi:glutaminyl-tRNA synthetase